MTLQKDKTITIPMPLFSALIALLVSVITAWGVISAKTAIFDIKTNRNEIEIERLHDNKVSKDQFQLVLQRLDNLESKIDKLNDKGSE